MRRVPFRQQPSRVSIAACSIAVAAAASLFTWKPAIVQAQPPVGTEVSLGSLKTVPTPEPANLNQFLKDGADARAAAIALGKALFWDSAVGSDGTACATCHFNAGADSRTKNQLDPGLRAIPPDSLFSTGTPFFFGPNKQLVVSDFPFHRLSDPTDRHTVIADTNDIASSQGVTPFVFVDIQPGSINETAGAPTANAAIFGSGVRAVEPRNTPTVINAIFNYRNFWDGRARFEFNGVNPIGDLDPTARVFDAPTGASLVSIQLNGNLRLENASLASQATGPPTSDLEMSYAGRTFAKIGKKMLALQHALPTQLVALDDSVLGTMSRSPQPGIGPNYQSLIQQAFQPRWWRSNRVITFNPDGSFNIDGPPPPGQNETNRFTQAEANFSLFWGIAIQMYEATLRADDTPFDRAFDSGNPLTFSSPAWGAAEKLGLDVFQNKGKCIACHGGPELTNASVQNVRK
jgi:cytochrome c peroxidase